MRRERYSLWLIGCWLVAGIVIGALAASVSAQKGQKSKKFLTGPMTIEDQGSFFIGGVPKVTDYAGPAAAPGTPAANTPPAPHQITIGQMYVQFEIPANKYGAGWPVIMVHGSSHTGACLESTPDGREGWYPYFVRKGVPSYVVDQAGRGRSGFDESVIHEGEAKVAAGDTAAATKLLPGFGRITDDGAWTAWFGHLVPANSTILTGKLIPHGDPADPNPHPDKYQSRRSDISARRRGQEHRLAPWRPRTCAGRIGRNVWSGVLQAAGPERGSHAARLHLQHLRSNRDLAGQHLDP